jgi:hypothetical protein
VTRPVGDALPPQLLSLLDGTSPADHQGTTIVLATPGPEGWPLIALLSVGELRAVDARDVRIGLWGSSATTAALTATGQTTMSIVVDGAAWDARLRCERAPDLAVDGGGRLAAFRCRVEEVLEDRVGYAELTDGIRFTLVRPDEVLPRWTRTLEALAGLEPLEGDA